MSELTPNPPEQMTAFAASHRKKAAWKEKKWAQLEERKKETAVPGEPPSSWEKNLSIYQSNPKACIRAHEDENKALYELIKRGVDSGAIINARVEGERSRNQGLIDMQETIDKMAKASGLFKTSPTLFIHTPHSEEEWGKMEILNATFGPDFIETNEYSKNKFLERPDLFKAIMAHEMAHIANGDRTPEKMAIHVTTPPNRNVEIRADLLAAIIHGNPREYARVISEHKPTVWPGEPHMHSNEYLSPNGLARTLHKWADRLEGAGALDENGNVIIDKAMKVFERFTHLKEMVSKICQTGNVR